MENTTRQEATRSRPGRRAPSETERALRGEVGQLADKLSALLPQYWSWVEPSRYKCDRDKLLLLTQTAEERSLDLQALTYLYRELGGLERTFAAALSGPQRRKKRRTFI